MSLPLITMFAKKMPQNSKKLTAVIIGAGRIAAGFDTPKSKVVLTHAHAYVNHNNVELAGLYDIDFDKAAQMAKQWSTKAFRNFKEMSEVKPDIVSVCTPDDQHFATLKQVLTMKPKLVITEKPLTTKVKDSQALLALYKKEKIPVLVNFSRRFDTTVQTVKRALVRGQYGNVVAATGIYGKGILHNGSHMIDLARFLFGEVHASQALFSRADYDNASDKTIGGFISFDLCPQFYLMAADERKYSIFELDIVCEKARLQFTDSGFYLHEQKTIPDPLYKGYTILAKETVRSTHLSNAMTGLVDNAVQFLLKKQPLISTLENAYETQLACTKLLK